MDVIGINGAANFNFATKKNGVKKKKWYRFITTLRGFHIPNYSIKKPQKINFTVFYNLWANYLILADFTVFIILPAILYGSPLDAGLLSSSQPFQPFSTVIIGILIDAPLSDTP